MLVNSFANLIRSKLIFPRSQFKRGIYQAPRVTSRFRLIQIEAESAGKLQSHNAGYRNADEKQAYRRCRLFK